MNTIELPALLYFGINWLILLVGIYIGATYSRRVLRGKEQQPSDASAEIVQAACAWVDRIQDPPNQWADEEDFALIAAVKAYRETL